MMNRASQLPDPLVEAVRHGRLIPFVGSLLAFAAQDQQGGSLLPGWRELLGAAADQLHELKRHNEERNLRQLLEKRHPDWYQAAITARAALPGNEWLHFLHDQWNPSFTRASPISLSPARSLWNLGAKLQITTSHDRLLNWACPEIQDLHHWNVEPPEFVQRQSLEAFKAPVLWHLHGSITDPANLILTPGGRRRLHPESSDSSRRYRNALSVLQNMLLSHTLLFVGFGQKDSYFLELLQQLQDLFHQCGGPHYALVPLEELSGLKERINTLPVTILGYQGSLEDLLVELAQKTMPPHHFLDHSDQALTQEPTLAMRHLRSKNAGIGEDSIQLPPRYQILEKIGQGGMGIVYRGHDRHLDRDVAVKVILPSLLSKEADARFTLEARAIAKLDHPGIVPIFDYGRQEDTVFLTMPLVEGKLLRSLMRERSTTLAQKLDIISQLAETLDYSHSRGVIHCDIKPENVMVREEGGVYRVRIMDFGLARLTSHKRLYSGNDVAGTPLYLSPEQCTSSEVDGRVDIYALGIILYEFLAGEPPFKGTFHSLIYKIVHERPPLLLSRGVEVDEELESLVLRCLAKKPENRPQRGRDLAVALDSYMKRRFGRVSSATHTTLQPLYASGPPLIGREEELSELQIRLDACLAGVCQFVVVGGESGMGKTRLLSELEKLALESREPFQVWWTRFPDLDGSLPFQFFVELICSILADSERAVPDLRDLAPDLVRLIPALGEVPAFREAAAPIQDESELVRDQAFVFDLLARVLLRFAADRPTLILLENIGGAVGSLDALQYLVHRLAAASAMVVATYRTGMVKGHPLHRFLRSFQGDRRFLQMDLAPLDENRHRRLVVNLLGGEQAVQELLEKLYETSEGNPYFCQELVRSLKENNALVRNEQGQWRLTEEAALHEDVLPGNIQGTVDERLRHLPDSVRDTLATAAILGRRFTFTDLEAMEVRSESLDETLDMLIYDGILAEDARSRGERFIFQSKVVRDVLYQHFSRRKRRSLHHRYALHLERLFAGKLERIYPELVHHFAEGDDADKTVHYAIVQAKRALQAFAPEEAIRSVERALGFVRDKDYMGDAQVEGKLCMLLARSQLALGHLELALGDASEAVRAYKKNNDAHSAAEAALLAAETAWRLHKIDATRRWVENGIVLARSSESHLALHGLLTLAAKVANLSRNYDYARICLKEADSLTAHSAYPRITGPIPIGGTLFSAVLQPLQNFRPGHIQTVDELEVAAILFETLLTMDDDGVPSPLLARSWDSLDQSQQFRFKLDPQATFSDGHPLQAQHVKQSFEAAAQGPMGRKAPAFKAMVGIEAFLEGSAAQIAGILVEDPLTVLFQLSQPLAVFPALLTDHANTAIFRACNVRPESSILGTGAFFLQDQKPDGLVLVRNNHYWRQLLASLESLEIRFLADPDAILTGLRQGQLDMGRSLPAAQIDSLLKLPHFQRGLVECTRKSVGILLFNQNSKVLTSALVRLALLGLLRTRELVWNNLGRAVQPATCLFPPGVFGHDNARRSAVPKHGGEAFLLRDHGLIPPIRLRATIHPMIETLYAPLVSAVFKEWLTLGFEIEFLPYQDHEVDQADLALTLYQGQYDDPDAYVYSLFHSQTGAYRGWCGNEALDQLLETARSCEYGEQRRNHYRQIETDLLDKGLVLPLFYEIDSRVAATHLKGVSLSPNPPFLDYLGMGKTSDLKARAIGGLIRVPLLSGLDQLDPALMPSYDHGEVVPNIFETLTRVGDGALVEPWLASFRTHDGGRRYEFRLRENVYFHDGRRLTTRDVRYSFERIVRESKLHGPLLHGISGALAYRDGKTSEIKGLTLVSDRHFTIELEKPLFFFPGILTHPALGILPEGLVPLADKVETYIGTGPFQLSALQPDVRVMLRANLQYWKKGFPCCDQLEFHLNLTPNQVAKGFRDGFLTLATGMYPNELESLRSQGGYRQAMPEAPGLSTYFCVFNTHDGYFADAQARRAFAETLDLDLLVRETLSGICVPAAGLIPPGLSGRERCLLAHPDSSFHTIPNLIKLRAAVHPSFYNQFVRFWEQATGVLDQHGFALEAVHRSVFGSLGELPGPIDLVVYRWFADYPDADTFVKLLHTRTGLFGSMVGTPRLDMLIEKGRIETDASLRAEIYAEMEELIAREALILPLFHESNYRLAQANLEGLRTRIGFPIVSYESLALAESSE